MKPDLFVMLSSLAAASTLATAQDLSSYTYGNAIVADSSGRYASPQGVFNVRPTPPTGPGLAILPASVGDNASGNALSFYGSTSAGPAASAVAVLAPGPFNPAGQGVTSDAGTYYAFEVIGPTTLTGMGSLVDMTASGTVAAGAPNGSAIAGLVIQDRSAASPDIFNQQASISCQHAVCTGAANFTYTRIPLSVPINHIIVVYLNANANSQVPLASSDATGSFTATLDPVFTLDASNAQGLSLIMDPRILQPSPVPEPGSHLMLLAGLVFIVVNLTQRRAPPQSR